jgi:hypothetical protein
VITVVTPSLPERAKLLIEAIKSVQAQTLQADAHHVYLDGTRAGPARVRTLLLERVETPLVAFLDDDDLLDADHLETLSAALDARGADLAYSWHRTTGATAVVTPRPPTDRAMRTWMSSGRNVIPVTVLARTAAIRAAGGFQAEDRYEDYALWCRMLEQGCKFVGVRRETWTYRFFGANRTYS